MAFACISCVTFLQLCLFLGLVQQIDIIASQDMRQTLFRLREKEFERKISPSDIGQSKRNSPS